MTSVYKPFSKDICRLISAAVVSQEFCELLLTNPNLALNIGYNGETFDLPPEERMLVLSIQAESLQDFAKQLTNYQTKSDRRNHRNEGE